jgi:flagellar hook-associated protein 1 FlgK
MQAFQTALETIGNNVSNSSTPGYANQTVALEALPFQPKQGLPGGVEVGTIQSARNEFSEQNVRQNVSTLGTFEATSQSLSALQINSTVNSDQGIAGALNFAFQGFFILECHADKRRVAADGLNGAQQLPQVFQQVYASLTQNSNDTDRQIQQAVTQINALEYVQEVRWYRRNVRSNHHVSICDRCTAQRCLWRTDFENTGA